MASITYDGQSFMLDGRRIWIVSGSINYARVPREEWADRIHAAKLAGLNTIETCVVWARHEPVPGQFDFKGDNDLRHFVELIKEAGLYCILRPGPYIGQGFDMGGMPPWLSQVSDIKFRTTNQPFLEAVSRYITEVARQVRDLQVTSPGQGGPILLVQSESGWTCGDDDLGRAYLGEIDRYLREAGFNVPTINANDLWQGAEGEIDCWRGFDDLLAHLRQLGAVHPDRPRLLIEFALGEVDLWGRPLQRTRTPAMIMRRLTETLAAGAQFNVMPFCGGTNFGFSAGRTVDGAEGDGFLTTSADGGSPISESGAATPAYHAVRRVATFASSFARLLAGVENKRPAVALAPGSAPGSISVVHGGGPQGSVAFLFGDESGKKRSQKCDLLLPDGTSLPVDLGSSPVGWCLFDTRLTVRAHLDFCNLSVFGFENNILVCFGAGGATGYLSINDSMLEIEVPRGKTPVIARHEGITVVVVNDEQVDSTFFAPKGVYVGVAGVARDGEAIFEHGPRQATLVEEGGKTRAIKPANGSGAGHKRAGRLNITGWTCAHMAPYTDGSSARFANIPGPADLMKLGAPYGYGWYRVSFQAARQHKPHVMFPHAGDRLHLWHNGQDVGVVGSGPGGAIDATLQIGKGDHTLVALAEIFGRWSDGPDLGGRYGWFGHAWEVTGFRAGKPKIEEGPLVEPLSFRTPLWRLHRGDVTSSERLTWTFTHRRKNPIIIDLSRTTLRGLVLLNNAPIHYFAQGAGGRLILDQEQLNRGKNSLQIALIGGSTAEHAATISKSIGFYEGVECITQEAQWAFAKWEEPAAGAFETVQKKDMSGGRGPGPTWWRGAFAPDASGRGVALDATGMTKGQMYVNGRHLGRYFVARPAARGMTAVGPQTSYHIPASWLKPDGPNELVLFDEYGGNPGRCKLTYENGASPTRG